MSWLPSGGARDDRLRWRLPSLTAEGDIGDPGAPEAGEPGAVADAEAASLSLIALGSSLKCALSWMAKASLGRDKKRRQ